MGDAGLIGGAGNQFIVDYLENHHIGDVPGNVLEIGVFTGATTRALAEWAQKHGKRVVAVDPFDIVQDLERAPLYQQYLNGRNQFEVFKENTEGLPVDVHMQTSGDFWRNTWYWEDNYCAVLIDGSHVYQQVLDDLRFGWECVPAGGLLLAHDYGHDIPDVTRACDEFRTLAGNGGMEIEVIHQWVMIAFQKGGHHA